MAKYGIYPPTSSPILPCIQLFVQVLVHYFLPSFNPSTHPSIQAIIYLITLSPVHLIRMIRMLRMPVGHRLLIPVLRALQPGAHHYNFQTV